jgi:hypothetical protein
MTLGEIALVVFVKGAIVSLFGYLGWYPNWEERAIKREQEKSVLRAYKQWRDDAGPEAAAKLRAVLDARTDRPKRFWSVKK